MMKFLLGVIVGVLIFFFFVWFGGGKSVKKIGEGLHEAGKRMEVMEETIRKGKDEAWSGVKNDVKKKILKEEKGTQKKSQ
jgi:hypothetical protein